MVLFYLCAAVAAATAAAATATATCSKCAEDQDLQLNERLAGLWKCE